MEGYNHPWKSENNKVIEWRNVNFEDLKTFLADIIE